MYILANVWFTKLMKQFFFWIDKIVFNFISTIYDLMLTIARTSVLTQADIAEMADRIYKLLAIFMIFKVTLSLITYVVNPDDFSDKTKGVSKLGTNIVISLALLILTPYIFNYAYQLQTIVLEDNSLATLIFGGSTEEDKSFFNSAGDDMAYITMSAFLTPNVSMDGLHECTNPIDPTTGKFNSACKTALEEKTKDNDNFTSTTLVNYIAGMENNSLGLVLRQDLVLATATVDDEEEFIMDYKFIFSTVVGVVVILLLINFCMDVAVRSLKLAFLQLIAPIPILSFVDPKSGKDGLFKKWYEMCFKTFLSLFIRLIALYFAVYIISKVADMKMVDLVDGSYQTNAFVAIFMIIGALMFAKQLPEILKGLGIKLDGDGKFFLNPLKKIEEDAIGGKKIGKGIRNTARGAAGFAIGGALGTMGALSGAGAGRGIGGAFSGAMAGLKGKKLGEIKKQQLAANTRMRKERADGSTFGGRMGARLTGAMGLSTASERIEADIHGYDEQIKEKQNKVKALELERDGKKTEQVEKARKAKMVQSALGTVKETAIEKMKSGKGKVGKEYETALDRQAALSGKLGQEITFVDHKGNTVTRKVTNEDISMANEAVRSLEKDGWKRLVDEVMSDGSVDAKLANKLKDAYTDYSTSQGVSVEEAKRTLSSGSVLDITLGTFAGDVGNAEAEQRKIDEQYYAEIKKYKDSIEVDEEEKRKLYEKQRKAKADETAAKSGNS